VLFADFFVITTVTSEGHLRGLFNNLLSFLEEKGIELLRKKKIWMTSAGSF
jgi:ribosomal silencing factor RsfS